MAKSKKRKIFFCFIAVLWLVICASAVVTILKHANAPASSIIFPSADFNVGSPGEKAVIVTEREQKIDISIKSDSKQEEIASVEYTISVKPEITGDVTVSIVRKDGEIVSLMWNAAEKIYVYTGVLKVDAEKDCVEDFQLIIKNNSAIKPESQLVNIKFETS